MIGALGMAWRMGTLVTRLNAKDEALKVSIDQLTRDVADVDERLNEQVAKADDRHEANIREMHRLASAMQLLPNKEDFMRFQAEMQSQMSAMRTETHDGLSDLKNMMIQIPKVWRETEAQEEQIRQSRRRLEGS